MLRQLTTSMTFETSGRGLLEVTRPVSELVAEAGVATGLLMVFVRHTSASLLMQETPTRTCAATWIGSSRGSCRMAIRCFVIATKAPTTCRRTCGLRSPRCNCRSPCWTADWHWTWQGIYLWEHSTWSHRRELALHLSGE